MASNGAGGGTMIRPGRPYLFPRKMRDWRAIRHKGLLAWFTWATLDQVVGDVPLTWWQRVARRVYGPLA